MDTQRESIDLYVLLFGVITKMIASSLMQIKTYFHNIECDTYCHQPWHLFFFSLAKVALWCHYYKSNLIWNNLLCLCSSHCWSWKPKMKQNLGYHTSIAIHMPNISVFVSSWYSKKWWSCGDKTVSRLSYPHNGNSFTGKMASLHCSSSLVNSWPWPSICDLKKDNLRSSFFM